MTKIRMILSSFRDDKRWTVMRLLKRPMQKSGPLRSYAGINVEGEHTNKRRHTFTRDGRPKSVSVMYRFVRIFKIAHSIDFQ